MLKIRHFNNYQRLEDFFNSFSEKNKVVSKDIKIINVKGKVVFYLILEF